MQDRARPQHDNGNVAQQRQKPILQPKGKLQGHEKEDQKSNKSITGPVAEQPTSGDTPSRSVRKRRGSTHNTAIPAKKWSTAGMGPCGERAGGGKSTKEKKAGRSDPGRTTREPVVVVVGGDYCFFLK